MAIESLTELARAVGDEERHHFRIARAAARLEAANDWALDGSLTMAAWMAHHCRMSRADAGALLRLGRFLARFPAVADAADRSGDDRLPAAHVELLRRMVRPATETLFDEHQHGVVEAIVGLELPAAGVVCGEWQRRAEAMVDDQGPPAEPERSLSWGLDGSGSAVGKFVLDPTVRRQLEQAIRTASRWNGPADARPLAQRRADALFDILAFFNANHDRTGSPRHRPHVEFGVQTDIVVVPDDEEAVDSKVGEPLRFDDSEDPTGEHDARVVDDDDRAVDFEDELEASPGAEVADAPTAGPEPVEPRRRWTLHDLPGFPRPGAWYATGTDGEPIDERHADALMCDCVIHRVVQAGSSRLDYGRATRSVPLALFRTLAHRDGGCRFPGCDRPVSWCDAHHVKHWRRFGRTHQSNLVLLCTRHHHLVHGAAWHIELTPDAMLLVTTPGGRTLRSRPRPHPYPSPLHAA